MVKTINLKEFGQFRKNKIYEMYIPNSKISVISMFIAKSLLNNYNVDVWVTGKAKDSIKNEVIATLYKEIYKTGIKKEFLIGFKYYGVNSESYEKNLNKIKDRLDNSKDVGRLNYINYPNNILDLDRYFSNCNADILITDGFHSFKNKGRNTRVDNIDKIRYKLKDKMNEMSDKFPTIISVKRINNCGRPDIQLVAEALKIANKDKDLVGEMINISTDKANKGINTFEVNSFYTPYGKSYEDSLLKINMNNSFKADLDINSFYI